MAVVPGPSCRYYAACCNVARALSAKRDKQAAKRFFRKALGRDNTRNPREIVTDRLKSYPGALREMKRDGELWRFTRHRRGRWLNNLVEQDHRRIKRRTGPMLGFQSFGTARRTLAGVEAMAMLAKAVTQTQQIGAHLFFAQLIRRAPVVGSQPANCLEIVGLGSSRQPCQRHVLGHSHAQRCHRGPPSCEHRAGRSAPPPSKEYPQPFRFTTPSSSTAKPFSPTVVYGR